MKLVLFTHSNSGPLAGVLARDGVVPLEGRNSVESIIDRFEDARSSLEREASHVTPIPIQNVQLLPPLPRPGKILCSTATYGEAGERAPLLFTLKSAESVIGPGQTVQLPPVGDEWQFVPEAELGLVMRGPAKNIKDWRQAVFGFTCVLDVMARGDTQFGRDFWLAKSDTLGPLGPCVVTADEIADPQTLRIGSSINGEPAQDYAMSDAQYSIAEQLELATTIMTLNTGDVLTCGSSRDGLRALRSGDIVNVDISGVGQLQVHVNTLAGVRA